MTAAEILAIPLERPESLFVADDRVSAVYRHMASLWHPDVSRDPMAGEVLVHLNVLHDAAERKLAQGVWDTGSVLTITDTLGKRFRIRYYSRRDHELGYMVYGRKVVAWFVRTEFADLFESARRLLTGLPYRSGSVQDEIARYMPKIIRSLETRDGHMVMVMEKTPDVFSLRDVLQWYSGKMPPAHVAWVGSALHNIACYLQTHDIVHCGITLDSLFISPEHHSIMLYGGWWYSVSGGRKMSALLPEVRSMMSPGTLRSRMPPASLDLDLVRACCRELLGDRSGMGLIGTNPAPLIDFLRLASSGSAITDYQEWRCVVLPAAFGVRRFVSMPIAEGDILRR